MNKNNIYFEPYENYWNAIFASKGEAAGAFSQFVVRIFENPLNCAVIPK